MLRIYKKIARLIQWDIRCQLPPVYQVVNFSSLPRNSINDNLTLSDFMGPKSIGQIKKDEIRKSTTHGNRTVFLETYGEFAPVRMLGQCLPYGKSISTSAACLQRWGGNGS